MAKYWIGGPGDWSDLSHWSLSSGGDAISSLGSELVTNGEFTGNADGWTLETGWAYDTNKLTYTPGAYQDKKFYRDVTVELGKRYRFSMNVTGGTAGNVTIGTGPADGEFDSNSDPFDFNSGVVTWDKTCDDLENFTEMIIMASIDFDGSIDDVSLKEIPIPSPSDDVHIDSNSGFGSGGTLNVDITAYAKDFICETGDTFTFSDGGNWNSLVISGDLQLESTMTFDIAGGIYLNGSATGNTIDTDGIVLPCGIENYSATGEWKLVSDLEADGLVIMNGTFDANDYDVKCDSYYFSASTGYTPHIKMGSGTWEVTGKDVNSPSWYVSQQDGEVVDIDAETSTIKYNNTGEGVATAELEDGGEGWQVDDYFYLDAGNGECWGYVTEVDEFGAVVAFAIDSPGSGYSVANNVSCVANGGSGTGLIVNVLTLTVTTKTFYFRDSAGTEAGKTYYNLWLTGTTTGAFIIKGSNTFNELKIDAGKKVNYEAGKTQTVSSFPNKGTSGNLITINRDIFVKGSQESDITIFGDEMFGASFEGNGETLGKIIAHFNRYHTGLSGLFYVKIYAHTGTYGVDGLPTGSVLATSDGVDPNDVHEVTDPNSDSEFFSAEGVSEITLTFSGANQIVLGNGTKYVAVFYYPSGLSYSNIRNGLTKTRILGNHCVSYDGGSTWSIGNYDYFGDAIFGVYDTSDGFISGNIEAQGILSKSSGIVESDYLDLSYSKAEGGADWYAGSHSVDTLNNDGWLFENPPQSSERSAKTAGKLTSNSERDVKTTGKDSTNSERSTKVTGKETSNDERDAKTTGQIIVNSERSAVTTGIATTNSERDSKVTGKDSSNDERSATVTGKAAGNSERSGKVTGVDTDSDERNVKVTGKTTTNSERDLKTLGKDSANSERSVKAIGKDTSSSERNAKTSGTNVQTSERLVKVTGIDTTNDERSVKTTGKDTEASERSSKVTGKETSNSERDVKVTGKDTANSERSGKSTGKDSSTSERSATLQGKAVGSSERSVKTHGQSTTLSERQIKVQGQSSAFNEVSAKTTGKLGTFDEKSAKTTGKDTAASEKSVKVTGKSAANSERPAKIHGKNTAVNERELKTHGKAATSTERQVKLTGNSSADSNRAGKVRGKDTATSERSSRTHGVDISNSQRSAKTTGKLESSSERGAKVVGTGKWYIPAPIDMSDENKPDWKEADPKDWHRHY